MEGKIKSIKSRTMNCSSCFNQRSHIEEGLDPPLLKIRIFKGNSGELINGEETKQTKKRKKKTEKQKTKMAKLLLEKGNTIWSLMTYLHFIY